MSKNSKTSVINLDKFISKIIHRPIVDGYPLYTRIDNQLEKGDGQLTNESRGDKWISASKRIYNSPGNIKRVFITHKGVKVHFHAPVVGDTNKSLIREGNFPVSMDVVLESMMNYGDKEYRVTGTGISAIFKPWVCSNIEEIYFDWTIFLSNDVNNLGYGNLFSIYTTNGSTQLADNAPILGIFNETCMKNLKNLRERYPRLTYIGYMQELEHIYHEVELHRGNASIEVRSKPWSNNEMVIDAVRNPNCVVSMYRFPATTIPNNKFSVKDGIYLYDREVLLQYRDKFESEARKYVQDRQKREDKTVGKTEKSTFENYLEEVYNKTNESYAKVAFKLATEGLSEDEIKAIIEEFSDEGKRKFNGLLYS